jgi:hypothetical protein
MEPDNLRELLYSGLSKAQGGTMTAWLRQTRSPLLAALVATAGLALGAIGAGCTSDDLGSHNDRGSTRNRSDATADAVPSSAKLVKRDFGDLTYRAPDDGTIWVVQSSDDRVIYRKAVRRGDEFRLEPDRNRASLNDTTVVDKDVKSGIRHRIYFESDYRRSSDTEWDLASDRARDRDRDRDMGDDRISRDRY